MAADRKRRNLLLSGTVRPNRCKTRIARKCMRLYCLNLGGSGFVIPRLPVLTAPLVPLGDIGCLLVLEAGEDEAFLDEEPVRGFWYFLFGLGLRVLGPSLKEGSGGKRLCLRLPVLVGVVVVVELGTLEDCDVRFGEGDAFLLAGDILLARCAAALFFLLGRGILAREGLAL